MKQNICIIAEPFTTLDTTTIGLCESLGEALAKSNRLVVSAGFDAGLLSFFAKSFQVNSGEMKIVFCNELASMVTLIEEAKSIQIVDDFDEQKRELIRLSDAFIIFPQASLYSFQFMLDLVYRNIIGLIDKPVIVFDKKKNYDSLVTQISHFFKTYDKQAFDCLLNEFNPWALINKIDNPLYAIND